MDELDFIREPFCEKCGKQLFSGNECGLCRDCRENERSFISTRCILNYDGLTKEMLSALKFNGKREYAAFFGITAACTLEEWFKYANADVLLPVPIHEKKLKQRGYNQAELIADVIGELTGIPVYRNVLIRAKNTLPQKELGRTERLLNLMDAFYADEGAVNELVKTFGIDASVIIVDDIYTTGATMDACSLRLMDMGLKNVRGLAAAAGADTFL